MSHPVSTALLISQNTFDTAVPPASALIPASIKAVDIASICSDVSHNIPAFSAILSEKFSICPSFALKLFPSTTRAEPNSSMFCIDSQARPSSTASCLDASSGLTPSIAVDNLAIVSVNSVISSTHIPN